MEVSWHLIDKHKPTERAALLVSQPLNGGLHDLSTAPFSLRCLMVVLIQHLGFGISISVATLIDMLLSVNNVAILVEPVLVEFPLDVHHMDSGHVDDI